MIVWPWIPSPSSDPTWMISGSWRSSFARAVTKLSLLAFLGISPRFRGEASSSVGAKLPGDFGDTEPGGLSGKLGNRSGSSCETGEAGTRVSSEEPDPSGIASDPPCLSPDRSSAVTWRIVARSTSSTARDCLHRLSSLKSISGAWRTKRRSRSPSESERQVAAS